MFFHENKVLVSIIRRKIIIKLHYYHNIGTILIKNELVFLFKSINKIIILHFKNSDYGEKY